MISKDEVKHIAKLARLELSEKEVEKMQKDLSDILDYFNLLKNVPEIVLGQHPTANTQYLRKDEVLPRNAGLVEKLVAAAPDKKDDYIKVKAIL